LVLIAEMLEQRLLPRQRASRARAQSEEGPFALAMAQRPAGKLAAQASENGILGADLDHPGPAAEAGIRGDLHLAKTTHADLGDPPPGLDAPWNIEAGIDDDGTACAVLHGDAQALGVARQPLDQRGRQKVHARPDGRCHPLPFAVNRPSPANTSRTWRLRASTKSRA